MARPQSLLLKTGLDLALASKNYRNQVAIFASISYLASSSHFCVRAFSVKASSASKQQSSSTPLFASFSTQSTTIMREERKPSHAWCCTASLDKTTKLPVITSVAGDVPVVPTHRTTPTASTTNTTTTEMSFLKYSEKNETFDLTSSSDWMGWIETMEERENDEGGAGAYDTMRCDLIVKKPTVTAATSTEKDWLIWGEDYHMKRLQRSFASLLDASTGATLTNDEEFFEKAVHESESVLQALIKEAQSSAYLKDNSLVSPGEKEDTNHTWIQLVKLTLLWSLPNAKTESSSEHRIVVRGHACSSSYPIPVFRSVQPIVVTVAALGHDHHRQIKADGHVDVDVDVSLPTRFQNPQSKVASWTKQRKKMDNPETYKPSGVSEVLMVRPYSKTATGDNSGRASSHFNSLELLEGLSSNVFVIYKDGTLRTPDEGVLFGYVRHLVLKSAAKCGLKVDTQTPITLQDALDGKWSEVFITSSSRLIWPISRILLPSTEDEKWQNGINSNQEKKGCEIDGFQEIWNDPVLIGTNGTIFATPQWQELLEEILHKAGYNR